MDIYKITAFSSKGELLLEDSFEAEDDKEAKTLGEKRLEEEGMLNNTHRVVSPRGKLVVFHT
ncbi:YhzD family protein [Jeotgalibacillus salarius]|uniref:YhzD-like protein n=1 Tax=Jeotgalibacillus salarius TaxID=546023 RepID=A0A4Y8L455_9BACL|nr:YhzD family protein [Jeotgalibacillus salarius]TFD96954.1 hypothetical protein E2626_16780 [Jeotgalibacillus salarius]